jgi:hypothetical protein
MSSENGNRESAGLRIYRFGFSLVIVFVVTLAIGVLVVFALSASACTWNHHVRCFSFAGDTPGVISSAAEMWFVLAIVMALFAATIGQMYRAVAWWSALGVVPVSIFAVSVLPIRAASLAKEATAEPFFFLGVGSVLLAAYQLSLFIGKLIGKLQS